MAICENCLAKAQDIVRNEKTGFRKNYNKVIRKKIRNPKKANDHDENEGRE